MNIVAVWAWIVIAFLVVPVAGYRFLRRGGRTVAAAMVGAGFLWAFAISMILVGAAMAAKFGFGIEWFGPPALALLGYWAWSIWRHPELSDDRERRR